MYCFYYTLLHYYTKLTYVFAVRNTEYFDTVVYYLHIKQLYMIVALVFKIRMKQVVMERPYLPSITALLCSSWAYFNEFLIQPSGRGSKCTLESANFSGCIVNVCVSVLIYSF